MTETTEHPAVTFLLAAHALAEQRANDAMWSGEETWTAYKFQYAEDTWHVDDTYDEGVASVRAQAADSEGVARHIALHDPRSVLRRVEAERELLAGLLEAQQRRNDYITGMFTVEDAIELIAKGWGWTA